MEWVIGETHLKQSLPQVGCDEIGQFPNIAVAICEVSPKAAEQPDSLGETLEAFDMGIGLDPPAGDLQMFGFGAE
jgi:hypothetical protein